MMAVFSMVQLFNVTFNKHLRCKYLRNLFDGNNEFKFAAIDQKHFLYQDDKFDHKR